MSTNASSRSERGLRLLSIDGGGIRGLSALLILREILYRVQQARSLPVIPNPCDFFDLAGGTGTGGLIVIMLFHLGMTIEDAIKTYAEFTKRVFSKKKFPHQQGTFKATLFEDSILCMIQSTLKIRKEEAKRVLMLNEEVAKCFVCATAEQRIIGFPTLFRSWRPPVNPAFNCTILEAARATSADPTLFKAIEIGEDNLKVKFIGGGLGYNNPVKYVLQEAETVFQGQSISCIVSLGTGTPNVIGLETPDTFQKLLPSQLLSVLKSIAEDCEKSSEEIARQYPDIYFRLNVDQGLQGVSLAEWEKLADIKIHTEQYLQKHDINLKVGRLVGMLDEHAVEPPARDPSRLDPIVPPTRLTSSERQAFDKLGKAIATHAYHDSHARSTSPGCLPGTRMGQIEKIMNWIEGQQRKKPLFAVLGPAGSGKSSLLWTVAQRCKDKGIYAAGFFFSGNDLEQNTSALFINTITYQMCEAIPELRPYVSRVVEAEPSILFRSLKTQLTSLLLRPLSQLKSDHPTFSFRPRVIVIDALDGDKSDQLQAISALTVALSNGCFPFLCLLSSRFNRHIENLLSHSPIQPLVHDRVVLGTTVDVERDDILTYLLANVRRIRNEHPFQSRIPQHWPAQSTLDAIVEQSGGQFIYAATVIRYIESPDHKPHERLQDILSISPSKSGENPFASLDCLYRTLMSSLKNLETAMEILGVELVSSSAQYWSPVTLEWNGFYEDHFSSLDADMVLAPLAPVLKYEHRRIKFYHLSFAEFLLDRARSQQFYVQPMKWQKWIVSRFVLFFYSDKGITMADVGNLVTEAKPGTSLHQLINEALELLDNHPRRLPFGTHFNIWPFVAEAFFWKLRIWISVEKFPDVFLQRGKNHLPLPVLIKLAPAYKLSNCFLLFELCRTMAVLLENTKFMQEEVCFSLRPDHILPFMTYLADYFDDQSHKTQNVLTPEDYHSATLRCLWYLQTPHWYNLISTSSLLRLIMTPSDIYSSLKEQLRSLGYLPALFGIPHYVKDPRNNITRGALEVLPSLLSQSPPSVQLSANLTQPFDDGVISMNPSSSRLARNLIHKYLVDHDANYRGGLFEVTGNGEEDKPLPHFDKFLIRNQRHYNLSYELWNGWE